LHDNYFRVTPSADRLREKAGRCADVQIGDQKISIIFF